MGITLAGAEITRVRRPVSGSVGRGQAFNENGLMPHPRGRAVCDIERVREMSIRTFVAERSTIPSDGGDPNVNEANP
jgi:hypothetical protein